MKILFACYFYLPHVGGLYRYIETLKKELEEHGHQVDILSHHPDMRTIYKHSYVPNSFGSTLSGQEIDKSVNSNQNNKTIKEEIDREIFRYYQKYLPYIDSTILWRETERYTFEIAASLLNLEGYDLIHTHDILSTRSLWRVKPKTVPLIATIHGILSTEYINSGMISSKESLKWDYAVAEEYYGHMSTDATIVPTNWQLEQLRTNYKIPSDKITVIPYGMDLYSFLTQAKNEPYPPLTEDQKPASKFIITCPARLVPEKDHKTLIEALCLLKKTRDDFICWLIGDGHLRYELELLAEKLGVREHLVFFENRWDMASLLRKSDMVVLASIQDMHPFTLMEAQVVGIPCVASDAGGIPEVVKNGETGLIFEARNPVQLSERILELMNNQELRSQLSQKASEWSRVKYSSATLFEKTMHIYQEVIKAKRPSVYSIEEGNLLGKYGLIKARKGQQEPFENLFKFSIDPSKMDAEKWNTIVKSVPGDYSLPDTSYIQHLVKNKKE